MKKHSKRYKVLSKSNDKNKKLELKEIIDLAHANKSQVLVYGAQGAAHLKINLS